MAHSNKTFDIVLYYEDHARTRKTVVVEKGVLFSKVQERIDTIARNGHLLSTTAGGFYRIMSHMICGIEAVPGT
jgi:hypothetical protein